MESTSEAGRWRARARAVRRAVGRSVRWLLPWLPFAVVAAGVLLALVNMGRFVGKTVGHPSTTAAPLAPGSIGWTSDQTPRGEPFPGITPAGLNVEIVSFDAATQTISARLSLAFTDTLVVHLRLIDAPHRALVPLAAAPHDAWAQLPVSIQLAPCLGAFFTPETCGKPITTIPLGQLVTFGGRGAAIHGSSVRAAVTLPVYGWPDSFPSDTYAFDTSPQITLPNRVVLATPAAGGFGNHRSRVPTSVTLFGDSVLGGHTLTAYEFPPPARLAISLVIGRPLAYRVTVYVVALLPLLLGMVVVHASARQGAVTGTLRPAFDLGIIAGLIAAMLAILPLRAVLVPADLAMVGAVLTMGSVLGVLAPVAGSTAAWAGGPEHVKSTETGSFTVEAGEFCDFTLDIAGTFTDDAVIFPDRSIHHFTIQFADTNRDTGFTLTERDRATAFTVADGQIKEVGLHVTFRTPDGKLVVVYAGLTVIDGEGNVLRFTPHLPNPEPGFATVLCPALGGSPAS